MCSHDATAMSALYYDRRTGRLIPTIVCECCGQRLAAFAAIPYTPAPKLGAGAATRLLAAA